jgi:DNA-directed RNA polymerase subunit RPC12/RpoP
VTPVSTPAGHEPGTSANVRGAVRLVCEVCAREFGVPVPEYRSHSGIVACPRCGSLDLVLIDPGDDVLGCRPGTAAG